MKAPRGLPRMLAGVAVAAVAVAAAALAYLAADASSRPSPGPLSPEMKAPTLQDLLEQGEVVDTAVAAERFGTGQAAILLSYDTRNKLETCGCSPLQLGGMAPRVSLIKAFRARMPVLTLDAGSVGDGGDSFNVLKLQTTLAAMREAGYDGVNLGCTEMLLPPERLRKLFHEAQVPLFSANVFARNVSGPTDFASAPELAGYELLPPVTLESAGEARPVAPPGFVTELLGRRCAVVFFQLTQLTKPVESAEDYVISDPDEALAALKRAAAAAPDSWILVAEGYGPQIAEFAGRHPEIRLVLSGDSHLREEDNQPRVLETGAYWLNTFLNGKYLAVLNLFRAWWSRGFRCEGYNVPILSTYEDDPAVFSLLRDELHSRLEEVFREQSFEHKAANILPPQDCQGCHPRQYEVFARSAHANSLRTLKAAGQQHNVECLSCHVLYDYTNDVMYALQCVSCHQEITPAHGFRRQAGMEENLLPTAQATYEFCARCHNPENSTRFKARQEEYFAAINHWE